MLERLKVSSAKLYYDNRKYESNPQNDDFYDLYFDSSKRLIARQQLNCIHDNITFMLNRSSRVDVYLNQM